MRIVFTLSLVHSYSAVQTLMLSTFSC